MADEVTDSNNVEQLVLCFRLADEDLYVLEDFVRIHAIKNIESDTIVVVVRRDNTLQHPFNTSPNCCGQCYVKASNLTDHKKCAKLQAKFFLDSLWRS